MKISFKPKPPTAAILQPRNDVNGATVDHTYLEWCDACDILSPLVTNLLTEKIKEASAPEETASKLNVLKKICAFAFRKTLANDSDVNGAPTALTLSEDDDELDWIDFVSTFFSTIAETSDSLLCERVSQDDQHLTDCTKYHVKFLSHHDEIVDVLHRLQDCFSCGGDNDGGVRGSISYCDRRTHCKHIILEWCRSHISTFCNCECGSVVELRAFYEELRKDDGTVAQLDSSKNKNNRWYPICDCHEQHPDADLVFKSVSFWQTALDDARTAFDALHRHGKSNRGGGRSLISHDDLRSAYIFKCKKYSSKMLEDFTDSVFGSDWLSVVTAIATKYYEDYWVVNNSDNDVTRTLEVGVPTCLTCRTKYAMREPSDVSVLQKSSSFFDAPRNGNRKRHRDSDDYHIVARFVNIVRTLIYESYDKKQLDLTKSLILEEKAKRTLQLVFKVVETYNPYTTHNVKNMEKNAQRFEKLSDEYRSIVSRLEALDALSRSLSAIFGKSFEHDTLHATTIATATLSSRGQQQHRELQHDDYFDHGRMVLEVLCLVCKMIMNAFQLEDFTLYLVPQIAAAAKAKIRNVKHGDEQGKIMVTPNCSASVTSEEYQAMCAHVCRFEKFFTSVDMTVGGCLKKAMGVTSGLADSLTSDINTTMNTIMKQLDMLRRFDESSHTLLTLCNDRVLDKIYEDFHTVEHRRSKLRRLSKRCESEEAIQLSSHDCDAHNTLTVTNNKNEDVTMAFSWGLTAVNDNNATAHNRRSEQATGIQAKMASLLSGRTGTRNDYSLVTSTPAARMTNSEEIVIAGGDGSTTSEQPDRLSSSNNALGDSSVVNSAEKRVFKQPTRGEESAYIRTMMSAQPMIASKTRWINDLGMQTAILRTYLYVKMLEKACVLETERSLTFDCDGPESLTNAINFKKRHGYAVIKAKNMETMKDAARVATSGDCFNVVSESKSGETSQLLCMSEARSNPSDSGFLDASKYDAIAKTLKELDESKTIAGVKFADFFSSELFLMLDQSLREECNVDNFAAMIIGNAMLGDSLDFSKDSFVRVENAYTERIAGLDASTFGNHTRPSAFSSVDPSEFDDLRKYCENLSQVLAACSTEIRNFTDMLIMCRIKFAITLHNGVVPMLNKVSSATKQQKAPSHFGEQGNVDDSDSDMSSVGEDSISNAYSTPTVDGDASRAALQQSKKKCLSPLELVGALSEVGASDITSRLFNKSILSDSDLDAYSNELFESRYLSVKVLFQSHEVLHAISETTVKIMGDINESNFTAYYEATSKMADVRSIVRTFVDNIDALNWPWMFANSETKKDSGKLQCENFALAEDSDDMIIWSHCKVNVLSPGQQSATRNFAKSPLTTRGDTKFQALKKHAGSTKNPASKAKKGAHTKTIPTTNSRSNSQSDVAADQVDARVGGGDGGGDIDSAGIKFKRFHTYSPLLFGDDVQGGVYGGHKYSTDINSKTSYAPVLASLPADNLRKWCEFPWYVVTELAENDNDDNGRNDKCIASDIREYYDDALSQNYVSEPQPLVIAHQNRGYGTNKIDKSGRGKSGKMLFTTPDGAVSSMLNVNAPMSNSVEDSVILAGPSADFGSHTKTADNLGMPMVACFSGIFTGSGNKRLSKKSNNNNSTSTLAKVTRAIHSSATSTINVKKLSTDPRLSTSSSGSEHKKTADPKRRNVTNKESLEKRGVGRPKVHVSTKSGITKSRSKNTSKNTNTNTTTTTTTTTTTKDEASTRKTFDMISDDTTEPRTMSEDEMLAACMMPTHFAFPFTAAIVSPPPPPPSPLLQPDIPFDSENVFRNTLGVGGSLLGGIAYDGNMPPLSDVTLGYPNYPVLQHQSNYPVPFTPDSTFVPDLQYPGVFPDIMYASPTSATNEQFAMYSSVERSDNQQQTDTMAKQQQQQQRQQQSTNNRKSDVERYAKNPRILAGAFFFKMQERLNDKPEYLNMVCDSFKSLNVVEIVATCNEFLKHFTIDEHDIEVYLEFLHHNYPMQHIDEFRIFDAMGTFKKPITQSDDDSSTNNNNNNNNVNGGTGRQQTLPAGDTSAYSNNKNISPILYRNKLLSIGFELKTVLECLTSGELPVTFQTSHQFDQYAKDIDVHRKSDLEMLSEYFRDLSSLEVACFDILNECGDYGIIRNGVEKPSDYRIHLAKHVYDDTVVVSSKGKSTTASKVTSSSKASVARGKSGGVENTEVARVRTKALPASDSSSSQDDASDHYPKRDATEIIKQTLSAVLNADIVPTGKSVRGRPSSSTQFINKPVGKERYQQLESDIKLLLADGDEEPSANNVETLIQKYDIRTTNLGPNGKKIPKQQRSKQGQVLDVHASLALLSTCSGLANFEHGIIRDKSYDIDGDGLYFIRKSKSNSNTTTTTTTNTSTTANTTTETVRKHQQQQQQQQQPPKQATTLQRSAGKSGKNNIVPNAAKSGSGVNNNNNSVNSHKRYDFDDRVFDRRLSKLNVSYQGTLGLIGGWSLNLMPIFANDFNIAVFMRLCKLVQNTKPKKNNFTINRKMSSYNQTVDDLLKEIPCIPICVPTGFACVWDNLIPSGYLRFDVESVDALVNNIPQTTADHHIPSSPSSSSQSLQTAEDIYAKDVSDRCKQIGTMSRRTQHENQQYYQTTLQQCGRNWSDMRLPFVGLGFNMCKRKVLDTTLISDDSYISAAETCLKPDLSVNPVGAPVPVSMADSGLDLYGDLTYKHKHALKTGASLVSLDNVDHSGDLLRRFSKSIYNGLDPNHMVHTVLQFDHADVATVEKQTVTPISTTGDNNAGGSWANTFDRLNGKIETLAIARDPPTSEGGNSVAVSPAKLRALRLDLSVGKKIPSFFMPSISRAAIPVSNDGNAITDTIRVENTVTSDTGAAVSSSSQYDKRSIFRDGHTVNNIHLNGYFYTPKTKQLTTTSKDARKTMKKIVEHSGATGVTNQNSSSGGSGGSGSRKRNAGGNGKKKASIKESDDMLSSPPSLDDVEGADDVVVGHRSRKSTTSSQQSNKAKSGPTAQSPSSTSGIGKISALFGYYSPIGAQCPARLDPTAYGEEKNIDYYNLRVPLGQRAQRYDLSSKFDIYGKIKSLPAMSITDSPLSFLSIATLFCDAAMKGYTYKTRQANYSFEGTTDLATASQMSSFDDVGNLCDVSDTGDVSQRLSDTIYNSEALSQFYNDENAKMTVRRIVGKRGSAENGHQQQQEPLRFKCIIKRRLGMFASRWVPDTLVYEKKTRVCVPFDTLAHLDNDDIIGPVKIYDEVGNFWIAFDDLESIPRALIMSRDYQNYFASYEKVDHVDPESTPKIRDERSYWFSDIDVPFGRVSKLPENAVRYTTLMRDLIKDTERCEDFRLFDFASKRLQYSSDKPLELLTRLLLSDIDAKRKKYELWVGSCLIIKEYCEKHREMSGGSGTFTLSDFCIESQKTTSEAIIEHARRNQSDVLLKLEAIINTLKCINDSVVNHGVAMRLATAGGVKHDSFFNYILLNRT